MNDKCEGVCGKAEIYKALAKAQGQMSGAAKDGANPHFRSRYATLASVCDAVRQPFADNGLFHYAQPTMSFSEGQYWAHVDVVIGHTSGQEIRAVLSSLLKDGSPQVFGSAVSYLRRYGLMAISGIPAEDDDGEAAQTRPSAQAPRKPSDSDLLASIMAYEVQVKKASRQELNALVEKFRGEFQDVAAADRLRRAVKERFTELDKDGQ